MSFGVVYAVVKSSGGKYLAEAEQSASSVRRLCKGVGIALCTDRPQDVDSGLFDYVIKVKSPERKLVLRTHIDALYNSPWDHTMFMDTDTFACADFSHVFGVLDHYDFAAALAPRRFDPEPIKYEVPEWFPERNGGVLMVRKNQRTLRLLHDWYRLYAELGKWNDQMSLRVALFNGLDYGLKIYDLPPEYNFRTICVGQLGGKAYIVHGRHDNMSLVCGRVNAGNGIRVVIPPWGMFKHNEWRYVGEKTKRM